MAAANGKIDSSEIIATLGDVTMTFDGYLTRTLSHVSLDLRRGEVFGVLGAKRAGKSTLLKVLAGRVRVTEGKVKVFGRSPRRGSARARVGYVPGKVDLDRGAGFFSRLFARKRAAEAAVRGGAGLTQAIIGGRDLIVLDEPFAETGPAEKAELKALIRELAGRGKTVVLTSDTLEDAKDVCERLGILHEGRILAIGSLAELLGAPGAIRFLAPVLPAEIAGRITRILREEIQGGDALKPAAPVVSEKGASVSREKPADEKSTRITAADEHLTALTKTGQNVPGVEQKPKADSSIDHEKLEELTKPAKPE